MSDKTPEYIAAVPSDVWLEVFKWATIVPGLMDIDVPNPFEHPGTTSPIDEPRQWLKEELQGSLTTRLSLVLVCKGWREPAMSVLYRCVVVRTRKAAESLSRVLTTSRMVAEESGGRGIGAHTRHLVVGLTTSLDGMVPIVRHLPNLQIATILGLDAYVVKMRTDVRPEYYWDRDCIPFIKNPFTRALAETCGPSLRRLHVGSFPDKEDANFFLSSFLRLQTLITGDSSLNFCGIAHPPSLSFITITEKDPAYDDEDDEDDEFLHVRRAPFNPPTGSESFDNEVFPHVRSALFNPPRQGAAIDYSARFLAVQGKYLTTVFVNLKVYEGNSFALKKSEILPAIIRHCPNLNCVVLLYDELFYPSALRHARRIPHLAIHFLNPTQTRDINIIDDLVTGVMGLPVMPARTVRFLNKELPRLLLEPRNAATRTKLENFLAIALRTGLQVQGHDGAPLVPFEPTSAS